MNMMKVSVIKNTEYYLKKSCKYVTIVFLIQLNLDFFKVN
jgi:hypothetical protein